MDSHLDKLRRWLAQTERYHSIYHMPFDITLKLEDMNAEQLAIMTQLCAACFAMGIDEGKRLGINNRAALGSVHELWKKQ